MYVTTKKTCTTRAWFSKWPSCEWPSCQWPSYHYEKRTMQFCQQIWPIKNLESTDCATSQLSDWKSHLRSCYSTKWYCRLSLIRFSVLHHFFRMTVPWLERKRKCGLHAVATTVIYAYLAMYI
jgi:hypothetical protein